MSRVFKALFSAVFVFAWCGAAASSTLAVEAPFYKVGGVRLGAAASEEVTLKAEGAQKLVNDTTKITITCTGMSALKGATLNGSAPPEPGTSSGQLEYTLHGIRERRNLYNPR